MDIFLAVLGIQCIVVGILGSLLPVLPGPPISYGGLLLLHLSKYAQYGFVASTLMKLVLSVIMAFYIFKELITA